MIERELRFVCAYCTLETAVIVAVLDSQQTHRKGVPAAFYCEHCEKPNKLEVPDNLNAHRFILGRDRGFLGYTSEDIALLQGEKEL